jgi:hypothetical protein
MNKNYSEVIKRVEALTEKSVWSKAVSAYAVELVEHCQDNGIVITKENMLNGAKDWKEFSYSGCSLVYDGDIAQRCCTPSELKKNKNGAHKPNANENWLDVQARALYQACSKVLRVLA